MSDDRVIAEHRFYRSAKHPDMLFEIRLALEDAAMDVRLTGVVAGLMDFYGWQIPKAIACVRAALPTPE